MQKSLSYNQAFPPSPSPSPSSTTTKQLAIMFQLGNSLTTTTTTTTTSKTDSENRVIFADPCSMCGTKKRRISPIHQNQDFSFSPRKKLFIQSSSPPPPPPPSPSPSTTTIPLFLTNSVSQQQQQQPILSSPDSAKSLRRCNSLPSSIENNRNNAIAPNSPVSSIKLDSFAKSPENRPSVSQPVTYLGHLGSFSGSSGSAAEGSPASASRPPRPPKLSRSVSDLLPTSSSGSSQDQEGWNILKDCVAMMNQLVNGSKQKEEAEDHKDDNENKQVSETNGEENAETEGNQVDAIKCSCGKRRETVGCTASGRMFPRRIPRLNFFLDGLSCVLVLEAERVHPSSKGSILAGRSLIQLLVKPCFGLHAEVFEVVRGRAPSRSQVLQYGMWDNFKFLSTASPWTLMLNIGMQTLLCVNLFDGDCVTLDMPDELLRVSDVKLLVGCLRGNPRTELSTTVLVGCVKNENEEPILCVASKKGGSRAAWSVRQIADGTERHLLEGASLIDGSLFWISDGIAVECLDGKGRHHMSVLSEKFLKKTRKSLIPSYSGDADHLLYVAEAGTGNIAVTNTLDPDLPFLEDPCTLSHLFAVPGQEGVALPPSLSRAPPLVFFATSGRYHLTEFCAGVVLNHLPCPFSTDDEQMACPCSGTWFFTE